MRSDQPDPDAPVVHRARTARGYWLAAVLLFVLAAVGGAVMLFVVTAGAPGVPLRAGFAVVAAVCALGPLGYWLATPAYRIGGGSGEIRFLADRLEVPAARRGPPVVFPRGELRVSATPMRVRDKVLGYRASRTRIGHLLTLRAGAVRRDLSTATVEHPRAFLADLERYVDGDPALRA